MAQDDSGPTHHHDPLLARQVEAMADYGVPAESIALVVGIDRATLDRTYSDELRTGAAKANAKVAESLFRQTTRLEKHRLRLPTRGPPPSPPISPCSSAS